MPIDLPARLISALASATCYVAFVWAINYHFVLEDRAPGGLMKILRVPVGTNIVGIGIQIGAVVFALSIIYEPRNTLVPLPLYVLSLTLFIWTTVTTRSQRPTLVFSKDVPKHIFRTGPYRLARHPFYLCYMLYWLGNALATDSWAPWVVFAFMCGIYGVGARMEENKFARSGLRDEYENYKRNVGMFFPKISW